MSIQDASVSHDVQIIQNFNRDNQIGLELQELTEGFIKQIPKNRNYAKITK